MKTQDSFATTICPNPVARRLKTACATRLLPLLPLLLLATAQAQDYTYTTNNGTITIIRYIGLGNTATIPSTINGLPVTSLSDYAFFDCFSLCNVTISDSVTSIGSSAFEYCYDLTNLVIGRSVTSIGDEAFYGCQSLTAFKVDALNPVFGSVDGVLFNQSQTTLFQCPEGKAGSYTVPNSVTHIGDWAFYSCASLTSVTIPDSVTHIGGAAFFNCTKLTSVTIGTNVTTPNSVTAIGDHAFDACDSLSSITMGTNVASIGDFAFNSCTNLTSVTIPNSVTNLGESAFDFCVSLTSVKIGSRVTSIGDGAFSYCMGLTSVTIPNNVTSIGSSAFYYCTSLASVTIGNGVTNIGDYAFDGCTSLTRVCFQGNAPCVGLFVFYDGEGPVPTVYYLPGTTGWENFAQLTGLRTVLWNPQAKTSGARFGVRRNQFGFTITGTSNLVIVVEASSLANPTWVPLQTNTLTGGSCYFSDPQWTNYPIRCYRLRSP